MAKIDGINRATGGEQTKNWLINGDMAIAQQFESGTIGSPGDGQYLVDRFRYGKSGTMTHNITRDTDAPSFLQAGVFLNSSLRLNLTAADTSIAASDTCNIQQRIEGYNWKNIAGKTFTLSFWVKATLPGIYCCAFVNLGGDRSYVAEYTINSANTWEYKTITVPPAPTAGTWNYDNSIGLSVVWTLAAGTSFQTTANAWNTTVGGAVATANQVNGVNTGATDFRLTGCVLNIGAAALPFRLFGEDELGELLACQRYFRKSKATGIAAAASIGADQAGECGYRKAANTGAFRFMVYYPAPMRSGASVTIFDLAGNINKVNIDNTDNQTLTGLLSNGERSFQVETSVSGQLIRAHYQAVAEL